MCTTEIRSRKLILRRSKVTDIGEYEERISSIDSENNWMKEEVPTTSGTRFVAGLDLCESFYRELVAPIIGQDFSDMQYSAALIGSGSEVLGFDTEMSADHHWGPRVMLFVGPDDLIKYRARVVQTLSARLPRKFLGYSTSYSIPLENGVQLLDDGEEGMINHRVEVMSIRDFVYDYLGFDVADEIAPADWLTFPEQKLLCLTAGRVFRDEAGLEEMRKKFAYYPQDVWLYLLASCWTRIEQEEHLMGRAGIVGDEIGSAIIGARLVRDLMRLCFLMERRYAPYPKWFGSAFRKLVAGGLLEPILQQALSAQGWEERQLHLSKAYEYAATLHNQLNITEPLRTTVSQFHGRPFLVISMGVFSQSITAKISDPAVRKLATRRLIGSVDLFSDSTDILADAVRRPALRGLYVDNAGGQ